MIVDLPDLQATRTFGRRIAANLAPGDVVALSGGLGAGKTTLSRAILQALGHDGEVPSPTFTILETYDETRLRAVHADFYRLEHPSEIEELGLEEYRADSVLIAEWPENAGGFTHEPSCLSICIEIADHGRKAIVEPGEAWLSRLP